MALEVEHKIKSEVLSVRLIPNVHPEMAEEHKLKPRERSLGLITATIDDPVYIGTDDATKKADVRVAYGETFYAGGGYPSGPLSGETIHILAGPNPAEVIAGLNVTIDFVNSCYYSSVKVHGEDLVWLAYTISRAGSYMAELAGVERGTPIAYLTAPPLEGVYAMERALKAADVKIGIYWIPPTPSNYHGALLYGTQSACVAACRAYDDAVYSIATSPIEYS